MAEANLPRVGWDQFEATQGNGTTPTIGSGLLEENTPKNGPSYPDTKNRQNKISKTCLFKHGKGGGLPHEKTPNVYNYYSDLRKK